MLINGENIRKLGIVQDGVPSSYRPATYDLTIGVILSPEGKQVDEYVIPPQGMVKVIASEYIRIPANRVGYVLVKTSLCNEGLLALNIGVVDPGYEGPLSSTLINFGKSSQRMRKGDIFSRLTVHQLETEGLAPAPPNVVAKEKALKDAIEQVDHYLGDTFLDLKVTSEKVAERTFEKYKSTLLWGLPAFALLLAVLTLFLNFANMWSLYAYQKPQDQVRTELVKAELDAKLNELNAKNAAASEQIAKLERAIASITRQRGAK